MDINQLCATFKGWKASEPASQSALGPVYTLEHKQKNARASALVISVPESPQALQQMRSQGMDDLQIMLSLQSQVDTIIQKCSPRGIPGLLRCEDYSHVRHAEDLGWDVVIRTEPAVPLSARIDLTGTEEQVHTLAVSVAKTLDDCQKKGISVGPLTPDRVFVTPSGEFRLTDLGAADTGVSGTASLGVLLGSLLDSLRARGIEPQEGLCRAAETAAAGASAESVLNLLLQASPSPATDIPTSAGGETPRKEKKSRKPLIFLIAALAAAAAVVLLLLRSCGGEPNSIVEQTEPSVVTEPTIPMGWSDWVEVIPEAVNNDEYLIQEQPLYRVQVLENTSSITDTELEGWDFVETVDERGEFLEWSEWADIAPAEDPDREIETAMRYRTKTKETTSDSVNTKAGWTLYDSSSKRTDFGSWGSWSTTKVSNTETLDTESKQQYQFRNKEYTTSGSSSLAGWTQYDSKNNYGSWGSWSDWSDTPIEETDTREVRTQQVEIPGKTYYIYGAYFSDNSPKVGPGHSGYCDICSAGAYKGDWTYKTVTTTTRAITSSYNKSCAHKQISNRYRVDGKYYYYESIETEPSTYKTQYSYRTRSKDTTYYYSRWGNWSDWSFDKPSASSEREVEERTVYRSRSCVTKYTYEFYRWTDWSDWSETPATNNSTTEVETKSVFRYRDREIIPTHYFTRWSDWSDYTTTYAAPTETQHVETKLQLRYCRRDQAQIEDTQWTFTDVAENESIRWVMDRGITKGTSETTFSPDAPFTRRQMAIMFWRALDYPEPMNQKMTLTDLTVADPYRKAINWAVESGIADVTAPGTFGSEELCTRGQFIMALYRAAGCPSVTLTQVPFTDVTPDMPVYNAVLWAYEQSISHGMTATEFGVDTPCTRLQAAVMFHKGLSLTAVPEVPAETQAPTEAPAPTE